MAVCGVLFGGVHPKGYKMSKIWTAAPTVPNMDSDEIPNTVSWNENISQRSNNKLRASRIQWPYGRGDSEIGPPNNYKISVIYSGPVLVVILRLGHQIIIKLV